MMNDQARLNDLEDILGILYEKLGTFQKQLEIIDSDSAKFELRQRIKREINPNIRKYETEYWELFPQEAIIISDEEAATQIVKIEQAVTSIEQIPTNSYPARLITLIEEIRDKLNQDQPASAKLKIAIPLIPAIASYELEMETEGLMQQAWQKIKKVVRR